MTAHTYADQRYVIIDHPAAPEDERWQWQVDFVRTYKFFGAAATQQEAALQARKRIHMMSYHEEHADMLAEKPQS
jgi:hypothetical protein